MVIPQRTRVELRPKELALKIKDFGCYRITVSLDEENFLMFNYPYDESMENTIIIENFEGDLLFAEQYNCGYGGHSPGKTEELLKALGIEDYEAERLKWLDGFQISFNRDGIYEPENNIENVPFRRFSDKIDLSNANTVCNMKKRQLYFMEPKKKDFTTLLRTLDLLEIDGLKAYIGKDNTPYYDFSIPYLSPELQKQEAMLKGPFIVFEARPFDVICFVGTKAPASIINTLTLYILGYPLLQEENLGEYIVLESVRNYNKSRIKRWAKALKESKDIYLSIKARP
ncbi:hypothetical protein D1155_09085 [Anaerotruncus sp. 80]|uniref:Uncharacterized protein n=1 Tax=Anaerotruncus colihominis TaxID=169435 RepID=A0A845QM46_9FIRM|nr:hypothetical protein [Anaerotruncus colihominis]NCF02458.1 hypothetical protein [Anaerotruncus sp. 80]